MRRIDSLSPVLLALTLVAGRAAPLPGAPEQAEAYVTEAFARNLGLAGQAVEVEQAEARLAGVRGGLQPRLDFVARYSRADGGRTIDFPAGDLLNGAYRTLNDYLQAEGKPATFPSISNQSITLLRDREQETKLRLTQPLYRPEIGRGARAARAGVAARAAQLAAYKRELRLTVLTTYFNYLQADAVIHILENAAVLTAEALRVNRELRAADRLTDDHVLRAEADVLTVRQQQAAAARDRQAVGSYFNLLLNRPLDTAILAPPPGELAALTAQLLARNPEVPSGAGRREELAALQHAIASAAASEEAARARLHPAVSLAVEGGTQGRDYRTGAGSSFLQGSLVTEVNLWDGRQQRSLVREAQAQRRRAELQAEETRLEFALQLQRATDEFRAATVSFEAAAARRRALARAFELVASREREGAVNQLTFLDARTQLTHAELNEEIVRQQLFTAAAGLDRAAALSPLP
jgi:outer membrane protein